MQCYPFDKGRVCGDATVLQKPQVKPVTFCASDNRNLQAVVFFPVEMDTLTGLFAQMLPEEDSMEAVFSWTLKANHCLSVW